MKRIFDFIWRFFEMTDEDFESAEALMGVLLTDLYLRLGIEIALAFLFAWSGEPVIAVVWLILVIPGELSEVYLHHRLVKAGEISARFLIGQFGVSLLGGSIWSMTGVFLWSTGNIAHMAGGLCMIIGVYMHVTFKYSDWTKGAIIGAVPPTLAMFCLPFIPTAAAMTLAEKSLLTFGLAGLMYYVLTVSAGSISKQIQLRRALADASAANRSKSVFLANMSHEIRTPMNGVLGMAELMNRTQLTTGQQEMVNIIQDSGDTLIRVIDDILDLSKIEAGHLTLDEQVFDLGDLIRTISATSEMRAREKSLNFSCRYETGKNLHFLGDPYRLRQVIGNLVSNAIKFTSDGSVTLELEADCAPDNAECVLTVRVIDTGPGLSKDEQIQIFKPFVQVDGSMSRQHGGTGLGLAIARQLSGLMNGKLSVVSRLGEGATFTFVCTLPVIEADNIDGSVTGSDQSSIIISRSARRPHILVVEDHVYNRRVMELMLGEFDVDLEFAINGAEAVEACRIAEYDLVLMDIQMPGISGTEALDLIREYESVAGRSQVPIIALTANAMKHQVDNYIRAGFSGHLPKPVIIEDLVSTVNSALASDARV